LNQEIVTKPPKEEEEEEEAEAETEKVRIYEFLITYFRILKQVI